VDVSLLTGESRPVAVAPGDPVFAGTVNRSAALRVEVEETGEASRVGRILREVEAGSRRRAPVVLTADRLAGGFVAVVLALALATWLWWLPRNPEGALDNAIALLIVTCPCALALATPLAITSAIGKAARSGLLIKSADAIEVLGRPGRMVLDKTGTLTEGRTSLVRWSGPDWCRPLVVALERHSSHPLAEGFLAAWGVLAAPEACAVMQVAGGGVRGTVAGQRVVVGSPGFVLSLARDPEDLAGHRDPALTPVAVAVDGLVVGLAEFGDRPRPEAGEAMAALRRDGWELSVLSGDDPAVVRALAAPLGFPPGAIEGGAGPERKLRVIESAAAAGAVVMVGDGINDAAAIARASVGVGVRGGAEASLAAADVYLVRPGLSPLVELTRGAGRTLGVIRRNIALSIGYNLIGAALAMTGTIDPLIAAVMMPVSSVTVVLASWRSRTFEARP
jgi:Cu2+-exporting ATPase